MMMSYPKLDRRGSVGMEKQLDSPNASHVIIGFPLIPKVKDGPTSKRMRVGPTKS